MAKYEPLFEHLCRAGDGPLEMTFNQIDALVGALPASARTHRSWWANETRGRHMQAAAWVNAGREVGAVDLRAQTVSFTAARWRRGS